MAIVRARIELYLRTYRGWSTLRDAAAASFGIDASSVDEASERSTAPVLLAVSATFGKLCERVRVDFVPDLADGLIAVARRFAVVLADEVWGDGDDGWFVVHSDGQVSAARIKVLNPRVAEKDGALSPEHPGAAWLEREGFRRIDVLSSGFLQGLATATRGAERALLTVTPMQREPLSTVGDSLRLQVAGVLPLREVRALGEERSLLVEAVGDGESVVARGALAGEELSFVMGGVARALAALHARGELAITLRPELVFVHGRPGSARLVGFTPRPERFVGGARPVSVGNPPLFRTMYTSPERLTGRADTPASDVFSFAASLVRVATGVEPFRGAGLSELALAIVRGRHGEVGIAGALGALVRRALSPDPAARPPLLELGDALATAP